MALDLKNKKNIVEEVSNLIINSSSIIIANYQGISVNEINDLRAKAKEKGIFLRVIRNTLSRIAFKNTKIAKSIKNILLGPLILGFSQSELGDVARLFKDFTKSCNKFTIKAISIDGKILTADHLDILAELPTHNEILIKLLTIIKKPVINLTNLISEPHSRIIRLLTKICNQKQ